MGGPNNPDGNSNITEVSVPFGSPGNDPKVAQQKALKPWSVRHMVRYFARQEWDLSKEAKPMRDQALVMLGKTKLTGAEAMALARVQQAMMANPKFSQFCVEDIDGKVVDKSLSAQVSLADLINGNFENVGDDS